MRVNKHRKINRLRMPTVPRPLSNDSRFYITAIIRPFLLQQRYRYKDARLSPRTTRDSVPFDNYSQVGGGDRNQSISRDIDMQWG